MSDIFRSQQMTSHLRTAGWKREALGENVFMKAVIFLEVAGQQIFIQIISMTDGSVEASRLAPLRWLSDRYPFSLQEAIFIMHTFLPMSGTGRRETP